MTIGQRIEKIRKDNNLSQADFGEKLGVSRQSVSRWESDASIPDIEKLVKISKLYNVSIDYLMGNEIPVVQKVKKPNKIFNIIIILLLVVCFYMIYNLNLRVNDMRYYYNNVPYVQYIDVSSQLDNFKDDLINSIIKINSITLKKQVVYQDDLLNKDHIEFSVSITPKSNDLPNSVILQVESDDQIIEIPMDYFDNNYLAKVDVKLSNYMVFIAKFEFDDNVINEIIDIKTGLLDQSFAQIELSGYTSGVNFDNKGQQIMDAMISSDSPLDNLILAKISVNDQVFSYQLPLINSDDCYDYNYCYVISFEDKEFADLINYNDQIMVEYYYIDGLNRISPLIGFHYIDYAY